MSTATVTEQVTGLPIQTENKTYCLVKTGKDKEGNPTFSVWEEGAVSKAIEAKELTQEDVVSSQTFEKVKAGSIAGMQELVPDEQEVVNLFNRGLEVKLTNAIRAILTSTDEEGNFDFQMVEGAYSLREVAARQTQRRGLSETEKGLNYLNKLSPEAKKQVLKAMGVPDEVIATMIAQG